MRLIDKDAVSAKIDKLAEKMAVDNKWRYDPYRDTKADGYWEGTLDAWTIVDDEPTVTEWIPVAERMPEDEGQGEPMKVKDAIKILRMLDANSNMHVRGQGVAISMAIKALEQQPCEDTISRQAAIDELDKDLWEPKEGGNHGEN